MSALGLLFASATVAAQPQVASPAEQNVFAANPSAISITIHNPSAKTVIVDVRAEIYQSASGTAAPIDSPQRWKIIEILPHQTVLETNHLLFPSVTNRTEFLVQWLDRTGRVLGHSAVTVYPTNLLQPLELLAGHKPIGLLGRQNELKTLLKDPAISCQELEPASVKSFSGRLAFIGEVAEISSVTEADINDLAKKGVGIVWVKASHYDFLELDICTNATGRGAIAIVQPRAITDLAENPLSQLNLVRAAGLAVKLNLLSPPINEP